MNATASRPALWTKSMAHFLGKTSSAPSSGVADEKLPSNPVSQPRPVLGEDALARIGLSHLRRLPDDPRLLMEHLKADDAADAKISLDDFNRGIRRAVRLNLAYRSGLHRRAGRRWTEWVAEQFSAGYSCYQRYHIAAELQIGLLARGLPPLVSEHQARALAPLRKQEKFWETVSDLFPKDFPSARRMTEQLRLHANTQPIATAVTPRISLHRQLVNLAKVTAAGEDVAVTSALGLIRQAITILEKGAAP